MTPTIRCGSPTETRVRPGISTGSPSGSVCRWSTGSASSEGGVAIARTPDTPDGALGPLVDGVTIVDVDTGRGMPTGCRRRTRQHSGPGQFRGYYKDEAAEAERMARRCLPQRRPGLPRRARLRVFRRAARGLDAGRRREPRHRTDRTDPDALPGRHRGRGVSDSRPGRGRPGDGGPGAPRRAPRSTRTEFREFLTGQRDLGPKQWPVFVRVGTALPRTETFKIVKRQLSAEGTDCADPVYEIARPARTCAGLTMRDDIATMLLDRLGDEHTGLRTRRTRLDLGRGGARIGGPGCAGIGVAHSTVHSTSAYCSTTYADFVFWLGGAALAGATIVGINPTRGPAEMAADIRHADCQLIVTDSARIPLLRGLDLDLAANRFLAVDDPEYAAAVRRAPRSRRPPRADAGAESLLLLLFTSGTTGTSKAVRCSQGRLAGIARHRGRQVRPRPRRRRLLLHAAVPRQRDHGAVGPGPGGRRDGLPDTDILGVRLPARRPVLRRDLLHLRRQGAGLPDGHPGNRPTTPTTG